MAKAIITGPARRDLEEILDYIASQSTQNAVLVWTRFEKAFHRIAEYPGIGARDEDIADPSLRTYPVSGYKIIYDATLDPVHIIRIVRGSRDTRRVSTQ